MNKSELYVSVDVETSGPIPGEFSLLSIGACIVGKPSEGIYLELQPSAERYDPEALAVSGLSLEKLSAQGLAPKEAMQRFEQWIHSCCLKGQRPVFVGLNTPFDWSFINYYFHKYVGKNPFGFTAIDIKAYFMGLQGCSWKGTNSSQMAATLKATTAPNHKALDDAIFQAELFALMLAQRQAH